MVDHPAPTLQAIDPFRRALVEQSIIHDRPECWACDERNWSTTTLRPETLPTPVTGTKYSMTTRTSTTTWVCAISVLTEEGSDEAEARRLADGPQCMHGRRRGHGAGKGAGERTNELPASRCRRDARWVHQLGRFDMPRAPMWPGLSGCYVQVGPRGFQSAEVPSGIFS